MFRIKKIKHIVLFIMQKYKLKTTEGEYLVSIEVDNGAIVTTKDANGTYRNVRKNELVEV